MILLLLVSFHGSEPELYGLRKPLREIQIFRCFGFSALRNVVRVDDHLFFAQQKLLVWHASFNVTLIVVGVPVGFSRVQGSMVSEVRRALFFPLLLQARLPFKLCIDL